MRVNFALQGAQLRFVGHLPQLFGAGDFQLGGDYLRQANRHLLQRRSDAMGVAVIDFSVPVTTPFPTAGSPSRSGSPGCGGLRHCFYDDFPITNRLPGGGANHIVVALIVGFTDAHVGQHVLGIGDRHRVGGNVAADNLANLAQRIAVNVSKQRQGFVGDIERQFRLPRRWPPFPLQRSAPAAR